VLKIVENLLLRLELRRGAHSALPELLAGGEGAWYLLFKNPAPPSAFGLYFRPFALAPNGKS